MHYTHHMSATAQTPTQKPTTHTSTPAKFLPLNKSQWDDYSKYLNSLTHIEHDLCDSVMAGCIGVRQDLLDKAARVADIYHRVCRALHAEMQSDEEVREMLLRPLANIPVTRSNALNSPFCMRTIRADFFVDEENGKIWLVEVNSGGAGLTDFLRYRQFLKKHYSFDPPEGFASLDIPAMLTSLTEYCKVQKPDAKTFGFVAVENGDDDHICDFLDYSFWMKENTDFNPVLLELNKGELKVFEHKKLPSPIGDIADLDAVFVDWFEDIPALEKVQKFLEERDILPVPPRSDVLFENKHFLSVLQRIEKPNIIMDEEWDLLQSVLIPSFPLEEYRDHISEMEKWDGVVLKMDVDSGGENVTIIDFSKCKDVRTRIAGNRTRDTGSSSSTCVAGDQLNSDRVAGGWCSEGNRAFATPQKRIAFTEALNNLKEKLTKQKQTGTTWTVQEFKKPPFVKLMEPRQKWIEYDYAAHKFDLMTYLAYTDQGKHVLFGSRQFEREKIDAVTPEGQDDGFMTAVCSL